MTAIAEPASESKTKPEEAEAIAQARLDVSVFSRRAMVVVVGLIVLNVPALVLVRRRGERRRDGPDEVGAEYGRPRHAPPVCRHLGATSVRG